MNNDQLGLWDVQDDQVSYLCCKQLSSGILVVPAELGRAAALVVLQEVEVLAVFGCPVEPCRRPLELVLGYKQRGKRKPHEG